MKQSDSVMPSPTAPLPLETFLATEDPVWVWDGRARRIVWANQAAARLWGDSEPARLKRRRLSRTSEGLARMTELARLQHVNGEAVEMLAFPTAEGEAKAQCYLQPLQLAGDRPGLMVRVINGEDQVPDAASGSAGPPPEAPENRHRDERRATRVRKPGAKAPSGATLRNQQPRARRKAQEKASDKPNEHSALKSLARDIGRASRDRREAASQKVPAKPEAKPRVRKPKAATAAKARPPKAMPGAKAETAVMSATDETDMAALLARVSHEIRNPLTIIMGFAEILASERFHRMPPAKVQEYVSDIYRTAAFALGLADDLLNYAEFASGEPDIRPQPVDINALAADCLHLLGPLAASENIALRRRLARNLPLVNGDERTLRQSLLNLLMNSMRHKEGSGQVRIATRMNREGALLLSVKDDGPGMSEAQIDAALGPTSDDGMRRAGRRGLGLRLVRSFIARNGATFAIKSAGGSGTEVIVTFAPGRLIPAP